MKSIEQRLFAAVAALLMLTACAKDPAENTATQYEAMSLRAWIAQHRPALLENFQPAGDSGYYIDVIDEGAEDARPIGETSVWVRFNATARDLQGNLVLTRNEADAKLLNTYTRQTHYVPFYRYCGEENSGLTEGVWLAMHDELSLDGGARKVRLRVGAEADLYLPSILFGSMSGSGGYEGETTLTGNRPMILHLEIVDTVANPLSREGRDVDEFCALNGGVLRYVQEGSAEISSGAVTIPESTDDPNHPYKTEKRWVSACDSIPQLYVNYRYDPSKTDGGDRWAYTDPYTEKSRYEPYCDKDLYTKIEEALAARFHSDDDPYVGVEKLEADSVGLEGTAKIWYVGRFLDGFVFDTNIDEVKELLYGSDYKSGDALSYTPEKGGLIQAFYYTVPHLKYGQWAALITVSTNAYGSSGQSGTTTTTSTSSNSMQSYYDYLNYMSYVNSYYNNYYGGYYNNYYNSYYGGMYGGLYGYGGWYGNGSYGSDSSTTTTTTTTVTTEIPSFTPLIFQFYVEPK